MSENNSPQIPIQQVPQQPQEVVGPQPARREQIVQEVQAPVEPQIIMPQQPVPTGPLTPGNGDIDEESGRFHIPKIFKILGGIFIATTIILIVLSLLAHGKNNASGKVTLVYWGLWEDPATMQPIIDDFERQNPNIIVKYSKEDPRQYSQRLVTRIQDGNGPDIFRFHNTWMPMLQQVLLPIPTSVISTKDFETNYYPVMQKDLIQNGALYGIPLEIDTLALFDNKDIFDKAAVSVPTTWDDFITTAKGLTVKDSSGKIKTAGVAMGSFANVTHAPDILSLLFEQNGVNLSNFSSSQNAADALTFYTSFAMPTSNVWDDTLDPSLTMFATGRLAMYIGYSWDIFTMKAINPSLNFTVHPVPHLPGKNTTIASYWVEGVSAKSTHQKEALLFMQFLAQKGTQEKLYTEESKTRSFGELYARRDLGDLLKDNPILYPFIQSANDAVSSPFAGDTFDTGIDAQMNGYLENAVNAVNSGTSAQSAVDTLSQGVSQVAKQYGQISTP